MDPVQTEAEARTLARTETLEAFLKIVFDHIRNLTLCALMFGLATYTLKNPEKLSQFPWLALTTGSFLMIIASLLFLLNVHALFRRTAMFKPLWLRLVIDLSITCSGTAVMAGLAALNNFSVK